jgi:hypothetical protein
MKEKIEEAKFIINMAMKNYLKPIINSGFGKDSICVVHLCKSMGINLDIMFHRDPYFPKKYRYANFIIDEWNLVCRDYPAYKCSLFFRNDTFEVTRHYQVGVGDLVLVAMLYYPEKFIEGEYLCAYKDIYLQPKGTFNYCWDVAFDAHRAAEKKPHSGMTEAGLEWINKHNIGSVDVAYPIWNWTDQEVYKYIRDNGIPVNTSVYEVKDDALVPKIDPTTGEIDSTYNPDRRPACYECLRPDRGRVVLCPKKKVTVNNNYDNIIKTIMPTDFRGGRGD